VQATSPSSEPCLCGYQVEFGGDAVRDGDIAGRHW
jgi:hypothetical protein